MIDIGPTLIVEIINFLILLALLRYFAYKPLVKVLAERKQKIAESIKSAEDDQQKAEELVEEYKRQLADARVQAQEIVAKAEKQAQESRDAQVLEVKREIEQLRKAAQEDIARERDRAMQQVRAEMVKLSMEAATRIIGENMDSKANEKLITDFIDQLDKEKMGELPC